MTALVPLPPSAVPALPSRDLERTVAVLHNKLVPTFGHREVMAADAPSRDDRARLSHRLKLLVGWLQPADEAWIVTQLMALSSQRGGQGGDKIDRKKSLAASGVTLGGMPRFALAAAFEAAHRGDVGKPAYMPNAAELLKAAQRHAEPYQLERRKIQAVLNAVVNRTNVDPEHRKAVAARMRAEARAFVLAGREAEARRMGKEVEPPEPPATEEKLADLQARLARDPVTVSPAVRRSTMLAQGRDPVAYDEERRVKAEFDEQGTREAGVQ